MQKTEQSAVRLFRKRRPEFIPVTRKSRCLFRLGEQCNNACPMCSNTGRKAAFFFKKDDLLARVEHLAALGFTSVVVTGGEPTIHPSFWEIVAHLRKHQIQWDINTHGRTFHQLDFAERARDQALDRAIVSLHSHELGPSCLISGQPKRGHYETIDGIKNLIHVGAEVMINCVLTTHNIDHIVDFYDYCVTTFGSHIGIKFAFPSTAGKGGQWAGIQLRYSDVAAPLRTIIERARAQGVKVHFESVPGCTLGIAGLGNMSRSGFGETHYLEDIGGKHIYSIRHIEAQHAAYPESCRNCTALTSCAGVSENYLRAHGAHEFRPFEECERSA